MDNDHVEVRDGLSTMMDRQNDILCGQALWRPRKSDLPNVPDWQIERPDNYPGRVTSDCQLLAEVRGGTSELSLLYVDPQIMTHQIKGSLFSG